MKKARNFAACCSLIIILLGSSLALFARREEPMHKGKPISYWIDSDPSGDTYGEVSAIGQPVVPHLITRLRTKDTWWPSRWIKLRPLLPTPLRSRLPQCEEAALIRYRAAKYLLAIAPDAKPAIANLVKLINDRKLIHNQVPVAWPVLETLQAIGPDAQEALPTLVPLNSQNSQQSQDER